MPLFLRKAFPYFAIGLFVAALGWAVSFGTLPPADFTFDNGNEVQTIDPAIATGQPENRIINGLFEGLLRNAPPPDWQTKYALQDNVPMTATAAMSELPEISEDGRTYVFRIRPGMKWSDGSPLTAEDFAWSWMRTLHPETASIYAYQLHYVTGAEQYTLARVEPGDQVEVELANRPDRLQLFPRGAIIRGLVQAIYKPPEPSIAEDATDDVRSKAEGEWKKGWIYAVEVQSSDDSKNQVKVTDGIALFAKDPAAARKAAGSMSPPAPALDKLQQCHHVLPDFEKTVGVRAEGPDKLIVTLKSRTPYFSELAAFYPLYPVNRRCVEKYGSPNWTQPDNIVSNGPFTLEFRRIRDRIRMVKNPLYWDAANVKLNVVDAMATKSETTSLNMYLNGQLDWATVMPISTIPKLKQTMPQEFRSAPQSTTYFYRLNVTKPELSDRRVRRALAMAINKKAICELVTRAGETPATALCPPGLAGYTAPQGVPFDVPAARALLAEAGYADGRGLPTLEILYNDMAAHKTIAEAIQQMWKENLGVSVSLRGLEWGVYLSSQHKLDYSVSRSAWVADYADPNTFLDMFVTDGDHNQTGWGNERYDELIRDAAAEPDPKERMALLHEAETILLDEQPIIPIYFYVSKNLVRPHVKGFFSNVQDEHPLKLLEIVRE